MFVRPKLCLWAQAEPNAFFTSCEFKVFRLIHKVSVPKSAPPSLLLWAHGHTHAREARTDARCAPEEGVFAVGEAFGARSRRRGREKQGEFSTKRPYFCAKVPNFFKQVGHFFIPPPHPSRKALRRETKKRDIAASFSLKIKGSRAAQTRNPKRKLRNKIEFLFLSRKRLFVFTTSQRNKRAKERAYPKDCVPLGYHPRRHAPFGAGRRAQRITIS